MAIDHLVVERMIAETFVQSRDQHIGKDGAIAVMNMLSAAGLKIVEQTAAEREFSQPPPARS